MKLSCLPVSFFPDMFAGRLTIAQWAKEAAGLGLDAIDLTRLFLGSLTDEEIKRIRQDVEDEGIRVLVVNTYPDFTHPDVAQRKLACRQTKKDIEQAGLIGAKIVRVTAGQSHPETQRKDGVRWAIEGLLAVEDHAQACGVTLALENHSKPSVWHYYDFAYPTDVFLELARNLSGSSIRLLFDTANTLAYGDAPLPVLEEVYDRIICIHAADILEKGVFQPSIIGKGVVPFRELFHFLKSSGYSEWVSIEEASGTGKSGVKEAVEFIRKTWDEA